MSALKRICRKYFDYYDKQSGLFQSASISLISKHALPDLATTIRDLHQTLADVNPDVVQQFNRQKQYPCYDFKDAYSHTNTDSKKWSEELDSVIVVE